MQLRIHDEQDERIKNARIMFVPTKEENLDEKRIVLLAKSIHHVLNDYSEIPLEVVDYMKRICSL